MSVAPMTVGRVDGVLRGVELDALERLIAKGDGLVGEELEEILAGVGAGVGSADDLDDVVEVVERDLVAEQDVLALARLAQQEGGAAADDVAAVLDEGADGLGRAAARGAGR